VISNYVLAAGLTFGQPVGHVLPDQDAPRYAAKALYRQLGVDVMVSNWEQRHLQFDKYPELAYIGIVARIATERRVTYTWRF
jgi:hypothetical protein